MPKMKTNKSVAGRFKITAKGKIVRSRPGKRHLLTKKSSKRKRQLKKDALVYKGLLKTYKHMMCAH